MSKILINKETRKILRTGNKVYMAPENGAGFPVELATSEGMEAALVKKNVGKIYKFVGETNEMFTNGSFYEVVEEKEPAGWYVDATGKFIPWEALVSSGKININEGSITTTYLSSLSSGRLIIDETITSIGEYAFNDCRNLTNIILPEGVTSIGTGAFQDCFDLTNIIIPTSVTNIGDDAFYNCDSLTSIEIPEGVIRIGSSAFGYCTSLANIVIPTSVTNIGEYAFNGCVKLTNIEIPDGITSISKGTFHSCISLTSIIIPTSVTNIGEYAFYNCRNLTSITLSEGITSISSGAFHDCTSLTNIIIPTSVIYIEPHTFYRCSSLTIYCDAFSEPSGWASNWNLDNRPVYWAGEWHYDENGNPTPGAPESDPNLPNIGEVSTFEIYHIHGLGNAFTFQYVVGITWEEWFESEYFGVDSNGYYGDYMNHNDGYIHFGSPAGDAIVTKDGIDVKATDLIESYSYSTRDAQF